MNQSHEEQLNTNTEPLPENDASAETSAGSESMEQVIEKLEARIAAKEDERMRLLAEFDNFKKRNTRERHDAIRYANQGLIGEMLGVLDTFDLAVNHIADPEANKSIVDGIDMMRKQLMTVLKKHGLEEITSSGEFDPNLHEAVMQSASDNHEDGHIVAVMQKGYRLHDRVIRPAMVSVCKK